MASQLTAETPCDGTSLADDAGVRVNPANRSAVVDAAWRRQRDIFFVSEAQKTSRLMMFVGVFVQIFTLSVIYHSGYPTWRIGALAGLYAVFAVAHRIIMRCTLDPQKVAGAFIQMSIAAQIFIVGSAALTGGIYSPFIPSTVMPAIVSLLFFGPQAVSRWVALGNALLILAMVSLPSNLVGPAMPTAHYTIGILISLVWFLFMLHTLVGKLSIVASRASESVAYLREEQFDTACTQMRRLQGVGAKVAHELKNPLASIKGLCQLVARTPESERTQERLAVVSSEISRMETILNEYLSFSRPLEDIKPETINLAVLAQDVLDILDGRAVQAGITLSLEGSAQPVQGDPRRLKEALLNLASNALEATPNGGSVKLRVRSTAQSVMLDVVDSGRGIPPEDLERLGAPFFTTRPNGTGLGVVLAQGVITQHGGSLAYVSTPGKGTTATISLPAKSAIASSIDTSASPRAAMASSRA
ncbi:MAG: HAMP domain-containing histidine kinase [Myxococcota bacterium]|nr:HAMP domain-containing histidine kinase [Myxococcota bacterium]